MAQPKTSGPQRNTDATKPRNKKACALKMEEKDAKNIQVKKKLVPTAKKPTMKHQSKQSRRVEVLDAKLLENIPLPPVRVESETCRISLNDRIQQITGIPKAKLHDMLPSLPISKSVAILSENELNHPKLQSSLTLLQTLEELKKLEINIPQLTNLKLQDKSTEKNLEKKMCSVLNVDPSERVFSNLQPLVMNLEQLTDVEELKRQNLAERCAPKRIVKDPELLLKDFIQTPCSYREPWIPKHTTFLEKCHDFQIDPFSLLSVPESNQLASYCFWLGN